MTLIVDEFHTIPGADYEQVFGELAKYGANMMLATQTLARLDRLTDAQRTRDLRAAVFSNLDGLFAFHIQRRGRRVPGRRARWRAGRAGRARARSLPVLRADHRHPHRRAAASFSVNSIRRRLVTNGSVQLARYSAERYGRDALDVELDLQAALDRIRGPRGNAAAEESDAPASPEAASPNAGVPLPSGIVAGSELPAP